MKTFTYGSAFAGIGGMTLGLEPLGGRGVIAWEYDPTEKRRQYAQEAHLLLHPHIPVEGDICAANVNDIPDMDLFCFTPPCQSFSIAGLRGGFDDTRGTLTFEALRIAKAKQPRVLFMENVKGLLSHDKGNTLSTIIHAVNDVGYTVDFTIINSKFYDVAQNRERLYMVAVRNDLIEHEAWHDTKGTKVINRTKKRIQDEGARTFNFDWPVRNEVTTRLRDFLEADVAPNFYLREEVTANLIKELSDKGLNDAPEIDLVGSLKPPESTRHGERDRVWGANGIAGTIKASDYKQPRPIAEEIKGLPIKDANVKGFTVAVEGDSVNLNYVNSTTRRGRVGKQIANTLEASGINIAVVEKLGNVNPSGNGMNGNVYSVESGLCPTLTTNKGEGVKVLVDDAAPIMVGHVDVNGHDICKRVYDDGGISPTIPTGSSGNTTPKIVEVRPCMTPEIAKKSQNGRRFKENDDVAFTITASDRHGVLLTEKLADEVSSIIKQSRANTDNIDFTMKENGDIRTHKTNAKKDGISELQINFEDNTSNTVTAAHAPKIYGESTQYRIRKLTPRECLRLQAVPEPVIDLILANFSNSRAYKFAGNGLTTTVISAIGERLLPYLVEADAVGIAA